jgi:D-serine deaminase-like pyridoxal phosphate-dependent protein
MSSSPARAAAAVDAGLKAVALDSGPPLVDPSFVLPPPPEAGGAPGAGGSSSSGSGIEGRASSGSGGAGSPVAPEYKCAGDEHGLLLYPLPGAVPGMGPADGLLPPVGARLRMQPGHCDPTVRVVAGTGPAWGDRAGAPGWQRSGSASSCAPNLRPPAFLEPHQGH